MVENLVMLWWYWAIIGLGLIVIELVMPVNFFLWLGLASLALSGAVMLLPTISIPFQIILFCILAFVFTYGGKRWIKSHSPAESFLNKRGTHNIGKTFILDAPIVDGRGHLNIDDTLWMIQGGDMPKGAHIVVVAIEGNTLVVKEVA